MPAHEHGGRTRRCGGWAAVVLAVAVFATACSGADAADPGTTAVPAGDAGAFCSAWPVTRGALVDDFNRTDVWSVQTAVAGAAASLEAADPLVPGALRSDWEPAVRFQETVITLFEIAQWDPGNLRQELIDAAFGGRGPAAAAEAAGAAVERIDAWVVAECGDFCDLWPRLSRALTVHEQEMMSRGGEIEALLVTAGPLVPDPVREDWEGATSIILAVTEAWRAAGWMPPWEPMVADDARVSIAEWPELVGVTRPLCETVFAGDDRPEQGICESIGREEWGPEGGHPVVPAIVNAYRDRITAWAAANCAATDGAGGLPGAVTVTPRMDEASTWFVAVLQPGITIDRVEDASDFLGVTCIDPWVAVSDEPWSEELVTRDAKFEEVCSALHRVDQGARTAVLPAGTYDLFVAALPYGVGSWDVYVPEPERCAVVPITVDGDTEVVVAEPGPCDLGPLAGSPEEIARRAAPAGTAATGKLRVIVTDALSDHGSGASLYVFALPAGTTLNDVGRGGAWPLGAAGAMVFPDDLQNSGLLSTVVREGITLPLFPYEAGEGFVMSASAYLQAASLLPRTAPIPDGEYTVYVYRELHLDESEEGIPAAHCATFPVTVAGDTAVTAPALEVCG